MSDNDEGDSIDTMALAKKVDVQNFNVDNATNNDTNITKLDENAIKVDEKSLSNKSRDAKVVDSEDQSIVSQSMPINDWSALIGEKENPKSMLVAMDSQTDMLNFEVLEEAGLDAGSIGTPIIYGRRLGDDDGNDGSNDENNVDKKGSRGSDIDTFNAGQEIVGEINDDSSANGPNATKGKSFSPLQSMEISSHSNNNWQVEDEDKQLKDEDVSASKSSRQSVAVNYATNSDSLKSPLKVLIARESDAENIVAIQMDETGVEGETDENNEDKNGDGDGGNVLDAKDGETVEPLFSPSPTLATADLEQMTEEELVAKMNDLKKIAANRPGGISTSEKELAKEILRIKLLRENKESFSEAYNKKAHMERVAVLKTKLNDKRATNAELLELERLKLLLYFHKSAAPTTLSSPTSPTASAVKRTLKSFATSNDDNSETPRKSLKTLSPVKKPFVTKNTNDNIKEMNEATVMFEAMRELNIENGYDDNDNADVDDENAKNDKNGMNPTEFKKTYKAEDLNFSLQTLKHTSQVRALTQYEQDQVKQLSRWLTTYYGSAPINIQDFNTFRGNIARESIYDNSSTSNSAIAAAIDVSQSMPIEVNEQKNANDRTYSSETANTSEGQMVLFTPDSSDREEIRQECVLELQRMEELVLVRKLTSTEKAYFKEVVNVKRIAEGKQPLKHHENVKKALTLAEIVKEVKMFQKIREKRTLTAPEEKQLRKWLKLLQETKNVKRGGTYQPTILNQDSDTHHVVIAEMSKQDLIKMMNSIWQTAKDENRNQTRHEEDLLLELKTRLKMMTREARSGSIIVPDGKTEKEKKSKSTKANSTDSLSKLIELQNKHLSKGLTNAEKAHAKELLKIIKLEKKGVKAFANNEKKGDSEHFENLAKGNGTAIEYTSKGLVPVGTALNQPDYTKHIYNFPMIPINGYDPALLSVVNIYSDTQSIDALLAAPIEYLDAIYSTEAQLRRKALLSLPGGGLTQDHLPTQMAYDEIQQVLDATLADDLPSAKPILTKKQEKEQLKDELKSGNSNPSTSNPTSNNGSILINNKPNNIFSSRDEKARLFASDHGLRIATGSPSKGLIKASRSNTQDDFVINDPDRR